jgi:IS30 family transposase
MNADSSLVYLKFSSDELGLHRSTIYPELSRNKLKHGGYVAKTAQLFANECKKRFVSQRKFSNECKNKVLHYLQKPWSLKQILGCCKQ